MIGISRTNGKHLNDLEHLRQSITVILTTRIGTRVMRRDFGSELPDLIDHPINSTTVARFVAATAKALAKWEPRLKLTKAKVNSVTDQGQLDFDLYGIYRPTGSPIKLEGVTI